MGAAARPANTRSSARHSTRSETGEMSTQPSPRARSTAAADWLPHVRPHSTATSKILRKGGIQEYTHRDWFLAFAMALDGTQPLQGKMLTKFYLFLRDFIPQGLTGRFAHINGKDVMEQLLCHPGESTVSRHKVAKYAEAAFTELGQWMGTSRSWEEAQRRARAGNDDVNRTVRRRPGGKAPGLHSPAGLLSVLVIAHPEKDSRIKNWIGRLGIDWMITQPRHSLDVRDGFWKGVNSSNVESIFAVDFEELHRKAEVVLLADYNRILGREFISCRLDLRPYLAPEWADRLEPLAGAPSDVEDLGDSSDGAASSAPTKAGKPPIEVRPEINDATVLQLLESLGAADGDATELEQWLLSRLGGGPDVDVLSTWCGHWEQKIDEVENHQEQVIIRSLFIRSLHRLRSLYETSAFLGKALMLAEMAGAGMWQTHEEAPADRPQPKAPFQKVVLFRSCTRANDLLRDSVKKCSPSQVVRDLMEKMFEQQTCSFSDFTNKSPFFNDWVHLITIETLYTRAIVRGQSDPWMSAENIAFLRSHRNKILSEEMVATLKLTNWQMRALLLPGSEPQILTDSQENLFRQIACAGEGKDLREVKPMPVTHQTAYPEHVQVAHKSLFRLFGEVQQPNLETPDSESSRHSRSPEAEWNSTSTVVSVTKDPGSIAVVRPASDMNGTSSPCRSTPAHSVSHLDDSIATGRRSSRFTGKAWMPGKRGASPHSDGRGAKVPRLGLREDLSEQLQDCKAEMRADIGRLRQDIPGPDKIKEASAASLRDNIDLVTGPTQQLSDDVHRLEEETRRLVGDLSARLTAHEEHFDRATQQHLDVLTRIEAKLDDATDQRTRIQGAVEPVLREALAKQMGDILEKLSASFQEHKDHDLSRLSEAFQKQAQAEKSALETSILEALEQQMQAVRDAQRPPAPLPGGDGYLAQCVAPTGQSQQGYESKLLRAAWMYIDFFNSPDGGVGENEAAWQTVHDAFPDLGEDHVLTALDHAHMQAYGTLFNQGE